MAIQAEFTISSLGHGVVVTAAPHELVGELLSVELSRLDGGLRGFLSAVEELRQGSRDTYASGMNAHYWQATRESIHIEEDESYVGDSPRSCDVPLTDFHELLLRWRDHLGAVAEAEWLTCDRPERLLHQLWRKTSERKLRLFAVACCRRYSHRFTDERSRQAVEASERHADGMMVEEAMKLAVGAAQEAVRERAAEVQDSTGGRGRRRGRRAVRRTPDDPLFLEPIRRLLAATIALFTVRTTYQASSSLPIDIPWITWPTAGEHGQALGRLRGISQAGVASAAWIAAEGIITLGPLLEHYWAVASEDKARAAADERGACCLLLRDVFGNPNRPPVLIDPDWLTWRDRTVLSMARAIYEDRRFADLPILADALEDAGCTDTAIIDHLRCPGPHSRGCHVLDLLLGRC